ncbi:hypothetical protein ACFRH6_18675 [Streptomyces sp. NPDC056749]|uniref:hypothetical protein n=1 Tax=Streptomyces sp. NPDC056749 TaxID=3345936 RepID=UPI0036ADC796
MNTTIRTAEICRGAHHLTHADVDELLNWVASRVTAGQDQMLHPVAATLRTAMEHRDRQARPTGMALAAVAAEWNLLRRVSDSIAGRRPDDEHVIWAGPHVYFGPEYTSVRTPAAN